MSSTRATALLEGALVVWEIDLRREARTHPTSFVLLRLSQTQIYEVELLASPVAAPVLLWTYPFPLICLPLLPSQPGPEPPSQL